MFVLPKHFMRFIFTSLIILAHFFTPFSVNAQYFWAISEGGNGLDVAKNIRFDQNNNVIVSGDIAGNPAFNGTYYTGNGLSDGFVAKYDENANLQWFQLIGGAGVDKCMGTVLDASGNIYLCGTFQGSMTVGNYTVQSNGGTDFFVVKLNFSGDILWLKGFGGPLDDVAYSLGVNTGGEVFLCGTFGGSMQIGNTILTATSIVQSYVIKLSDTGNPQWALKTVSSSNNVMNSLTVLPDGNVALAGYYSLNVALGDFSVSSSSASYDVFICSINNSGEVNWLTKAGGAYDDVTTAVTNDTQGNLLLCGNISGSAAFDTFHLANAGYNDPFIAKYDGNGNCIWARSGQGLDLDMVNGISCDAHDNVYATGLYENSITFSGQTISGYDQRQIFVVSYDANGNLRWVQDAGGSGTDCGMAVNTDISGNVYVAGYYTYLASFNEITLPPAGLQDIFLAKFRQPVSGISENGKMSFSVYPNPATTEFYIQGDIPKNAIITLIASNGVKKRARYINNQAVNVSAFASGIYTLIISSAEHSILGTTRIALIK